MGAWKNRWGSRRPGLSLFFIGGAILGACFCNGLDGELQAELLAATREAAKNSRGRGTAELFCSVAARRLSQLFAGVLFLLTPIAYGLFAAAFFYLGFGAAVLVCTATMEAGIFGIFRFLLLIFPQGLCYLPVCFFFARQLGEEKRHSPAAWAGLAALTGLGILAESLASPYLTALL